MKKKALYIGLIVFVAVVAMAVGFAFGRSGRNKDTSESSDVPEVTQKADLTDTSGTVSEPTGIPGTDKEAEPTAEPAVSDVPEITGTEEDPDVPEVTEEPKATDEPSATQEPTVTDIAEATKEPAVTDGAEVTKEPTVTDIAEVTKAPAATEVPKATVTPEPTPIQEKAEKGSPYENHGRLSVKGTKLTDKNGKEYRLRGVSTHGLAWFPDYVNKSSFKTLRDEWGANCIRLAMYTAEYGGYCSGGNKSDLKKLVNNGVKYATELGMYVIIDWHILSDGNPQTNKDSAIGFFDEMSKNYADYGNVIFEICNEPNGGTSWSQIKSYAEEVIPVIRKNAPKAIIVVGTPTWSQEVDKPAADPIKGYDNIMYTIHFYAGTHKDDLRNRMQNAVKAGIPLFCTEFGTCDASGNGGNNFPEAEKWIDAMEASGVSYCIWNLSNKAETSALISSSCSKTSGWKESELSASGKWYVKILGGSLKNTDSGTGDDKEDDKKDDSKKDTEVKEDKKADLTAQLIPAGSWNDGKKDFYQFNIKVENNGNAASDGWKVVVDFKKDFSIDQSWNGNYDKQGKKVTVTPVGFNSRIEAGNSIEVGFIISTSGAINDPEIKLK